MRSAIILLASSTLAACTGGAADTANTQPFAAIGSEETVHFVGTEPFWGGEVTGTSLTYSTPQDADGTVIPVQRFAGNNGLSFSGQFEGAAFDLMVTPGTCSDGMSDRSFPFVATLKLGGRDPLSGCAWTDTQPFEGPRNP